MTHFVKKFTDSQNCILIQEYECGSCNLHFLADAKSGKLQCFVCGEPIEAVGSIVIGKKDCAHEYATHGHEHHV